jgi:hypothetical protein
LADTLKKQGYTLSADVAYACAERMQRMEAYIQILHTDFIRNEHDPHVLDKWHEERWDRIHKYLTEEDDAATED